MNLLHVDQIMSWEPCDDYPRERIVELFGGEELDVISISHLLIPPEDIFWVLARTEVLGEKNARLFACDCAERVAHLGDEPLLRGVIKVARRYAHGEATDEELNKAATVAEAALRDVDTTPAFSAASAAAYTAWSSVRAADGAADGAARAAIWDTYGQWQLDRLRHYLNE